MATQRIQCHLPEPDHNTPGQMNRSYMNTKHFYSEHIDSGKSTQRKLNSSLSKINASTEYLVTFNLDLI